MGAQTQSVPLGLCAEQPQRFDGHGLLTVVVAEFHDACPTGERGRGAPVLLTCTRNWHLLVQSTPILATPPAKTVHAWRTARWIRMLTLTLMQSASSCCCTAHVSTVLWSPGKIRKRSKKNRSGRCRGHTYMTQHGLVTSATTVLYLGMPILGVSKFGGSARIRAHLVPIGIIMMECDYGHVYALTMTTLFFLALPIAIPLPFFFQPAVRNSFSPLVLFCPVLGYFLFFFACRHCPGSFRHAPSGTPP